MPGVVTRWTLDGWWLVDEAASGHVTAGEKAFQNQNEKGKLKDTDACFSPLQMTGLLLRHIFNVTFHFSPPLKSTASLWVIHVL